MTTQLLLRSCLILLLPWLQPNFRSVVTFNIALACTTASKASSALVTTHFDFGIGLQRSSRWQSALVFNVILQPQSCSGSNLKIRSCSYFSLHTGLDLTSQTIAAFSFTATLTQAQGLLSTDRLHINRDPLNQLSTTSLLQPPSQ